MLAEDFTNMSVQAINITAWLHAGLKVKKIG